MKLGRSGAHPKPLVEVFPRNVGTDRNIRCHRPQEFYVYAVNCKQCSDCNCGNQIIYTTLFALPSSCQHVL